MMTNEQVAQKIEEVVKLFVVPATTEELRRCGEAYEAARALNEQVQTRLSEVLDRMKDSTRCWHCGAMQPQPIRSESELH